MRQTINGVVYDTEDMLDLGVPRTPGWMGDHLELYAVYADCRGRLFIEEHDAGDPPGIGCVRRVLTLGNPKVTAYLVRRFDLPEVYRRESDQ